MAAFASLLGVSYFTLGSTFLQLLLLWPETPQFEQVILIKLCLDNMGLPANDEADHSISVENLPEIKLPQIPAQLLMGTQIGGLYDSDPYYVGGEGFFSKACNPIEVFGMEGLMSLSLEASEVTVYYCVPTANSSMLQLFQISEIQAGSTYFKYTFHPWECEIGYMNDASEMTSTLLWDTNWLEKKSTQYQFFKDGFTDIIHKGMIMLQQLKEHMKIAQNYIENYADKASYKHVEGVEQVYLKLKLYKQDLMSSQEELTLLSRYLCPYKTKLLESQQASANNDLHILYPAITEQHSVPHERNQCLELIVKKRPPQLVETPVHQGGENFNLHNWEHGLMAAVFEQQYFHTFW